MNTEYNQAVEIICEKLWSREKEWKLLFDHNNPSYFLDLENIRLFIKPYHDKDNNINGCRAYHESKVGATELFVIRKNYDNWFISNLRNKEKQRTDRIDRERKERSVKAISDIIGVLDV